MKKSELHLEKVEELTKREPLMFQRLADLSDGLRENIKKHRNHQQIVDYEVVPTVRRGSLIVMTAHESSKLHDIPIVVTEEPEGM